MDWMPFVKGSTMALGATITFYFIMKFLTGMRQRKIEKQPSYEKLKQDGNILGMLLYFSVMWVLWVPTRVIDSAGQDWMGVIFAATLLIVRYIFQIIEKLTNRPKADDIITSQSNI